MRSFTPWTKQPNVSDQNVSVRDLGTLSPQPPSLFALLPIPYPSLFDACYPGYPNVKNTQAVLPPGCCSS